MYPHKLLEMIQHILTDTNHPLYVDIQWASGVEFFKTLMNVFMENGATEQDARTLIWEMNFVFCLNNSGIIFTWVDSIGGNNWYYP